MAVDKVIPFASGGTLVLSLDRVNAFILTESERQLVADISEAVKKFERRQATPEPGARPEKESA